MYVPAAKKLRKSTVSHDIAPHSSTLTGNSSPVSVFFVSGKLTGKERDPETGLYYYGARYLDPRTSRWLSVDPAMGEYIPLAPINDDAKKHNENLPGMGGVFNYVNMHVYHYAGNNPVKLTDPDGRFGDTWDRRWSQEIRERIDHAEATNIINDIALALARSDTGTALSFLAGWLKEIDMAGASNVANTTSTAFSIISMAEGGMQLINVLRNTDSTQFERGEAIFDFATTVIGTVGLKGAIAGSYLDGAKDLARFMAEFTVEGNRILEAYVDAMLEWYSGDQLDLPPEFPLW